MLIGKISLPLISYSVAKTTAAKKLQNLKNEFVKIYRVLREIIKHINVKFELLRLNREATERKCVATAIVDGCCARGN